MNPHDRNQDGDLTVNPIVSFYRRFDKQIVLAILISILCIEVHVIDAAETAVSPSIAVGCLDTIDDVDDNELRAQGWIGVTHPERKVVDIVIRAGERVIYKGSFTRYKRPDVAEVMRKPRWIDSGWEVTFGIPENFESGKYPITARAVLDNGNFVELAVSGQASVKEIDAVPSINSLRVEMITIVFICVLMVVSVFFFSENAAHQISRLFGKRFHPAVVTGLALALLFICLVAMGTTGSSLQIGVKAVPFITADTHRIWGKPKSIRSDELLVFTPFAISQTNHIPPFPVINKNVGEDGQNMLVVGMTGVPVRHLTAIVKPATWGFFVFDLKRALSWYWWFPLFGCLFALWAVFCLLSPGHWRLGFVISAIFCASPYVAAWSYWPAYATFFASVALFLCVMMLRTRNNPILFGYALLLGFSWAGFVLVLYPPWQITLGYLFLLIGMGIVLRDNLYRNFGLPHLFSFVLAMATASMILWAWWSDAASAIVAMMDTVYPGQRDNVVGGNLSFPGFLRGFTNIVTLYRMEGNYSNQSEIASFYYLFPSLCILFGVRLCNRNMCAVQSFLLLFIVLAVGYMFVGVPKYIAFITFLGRTSEARMDLGLGLAFILLSGLLLAPGKWTCSTSRMPVGILAAFASVFWAFTVIHTIHRIPAETLSGFSPGITASLFFATLFCSWWLAVGDDRKFLGLYLTLSIATVFSFNPMMTAPNSIAADIDPSAGDHRFLVADTQIPSVLLLAGGLKISNGVFYYPQKSLWERLDPSKSQVNTYNRYQHLIFSPDSLSPPYYRIETPQLDLVRVAVDSKYFDFSKTGADIFLAPSRHTEALALNSSLRFESESEGWARFSILK